MTAGRFPWVKGHGTRNDFILLPDHDGALHGPLDAELVRRLCDRRAGIGADGVIRVIRTVAVVEAMGLDPESPEAAELGAGDEAPGGDASAEWFMDYRNADGSIAQMCGNGIRVLARYLWDAGLTRLGRVPERPLPIATRGGVRLVRGSTDGEGLGAFDNGSTVEMGVPTEPHRAVSAHVRVGPRHWPCIAVHVPNPHAVVFVDDLNEAGGLTRAPEIEPPSAFPDGVNVEFVVRRGPHHIALRVHERGVGETPSCGTGVAAAAWVTLRREQAPTGTPCTVDVPGGQLTVEQREDDVLLLTGPAVLGPRGEMDVRWLEG